MLKIYLFARFTIVSVVLHLFVLSGFGQTPTPPPNYVNTNEPGKAGTSEQDLKNRELILQAISSGGNRTYTPSFMMSEKQKLRNAEMSEAFILGKDISRLSITNEYSIKFAQVLKDKKVKLVRLYPERNCNNGKTVTVEEAERCADVLPILGGGSFYSFRLRTHLNENIRQSGFAGLRGEWADIHYVDGKFSVGGETIQGIISHIGDVDLQTLNSKSESLRFLKEYKPEKRFLEIKKQKEILKLGINSNGYKYSDWVLVKLDSTYILRSIAYDFYPVSGSFNPSSPMMSPMSFGRIYDNRIDVIITFKVIGQEKDGSLIILWKELDRKGVPTLIPEKTEK